MTWLKMDRPNWLPVLQPAWLPVLQPASCDGCGLCCEGIGSPVLVYQSYRGAESSHPMRPSDLPSELITEIDDHFLGLVRGQEPQEQCLWYDAERRVCRHYEWRPQVCRDYERGGSACLELRQPFVRE
jgi:Fe-S-cluster containining protein